MTVKNSPNFNPEFPESFDWAMIDSPTLCAIALDLVSTLKRDMQTWERLLVPGIREALREIAKYAVV